MLLVVVIVFVICWTPQQTFLLWDVYRSRNTVRILDVSQKQSIMFITYIVGYLFCTLEMCLLKTMKHVKSSLRTFANKPFLVYDLQPDCFIRVTRRCH
jgi:hypothetical protein